MKINMTAHHARSGALGLLGALAAFLLSATDAGAKLAAERWTRLTEEERHQLTRAERYVEQSNFKSALSEYELFIQLYGKSEVASYAQFMLAECTRRLGQVNGAINEFRNVIDYFPDSIDAGSAQYSIGVCQTQTGDVEQAVVAFEKVSAKWPKADFGALARGELCTIYWRLGQVEKWLPHMEYLATGEYTDTPNLRHNSQRRFLMHRLLESKPAEALAIIDPKRKKDALITFSEWATEALRVQNVSSLYGEKGTKSLPVIAPATVAFIERESATVTDPAQKNSYEHWCARVLASAGVKDKAMERFAALARKNPDNDTIRSEYAGHLRASGKRGEARLVYHEMKNQYVADTEIAETYGEENNWKSCIEAYQAMLNKHPQQANQIQWRLGEVLSRTGKYPEAIACYNQSQREPQSLFRVSECQGAMKQHDAAIQTLVGVLNFFKSAAPEAQYRIAGHYAAKGDKEAAIRTLKTVCKVYLNTSWAGRAHQDLSLTYGIDVTLGGAAKKDEK
jgi:TolA-binding protein